MVISDMEKYKRIIKYIIIFCVIVLIIDLIIILYTNEKNKNKKTYFDSINSFQVVDKNFVAVGSNNNNEKQYEKAKITKYSGKSEKLWEKIYNKGYNSSFFGIKQDGEDYIAVGNYESSKEEKKNKVRSALIVKYDAAGNILYENNLQILGNSKFTNLLVLDDGYIVIGQSIYENMTLGMSDNGGAIIVKYDKNLKEVWRKNYGGSKSGIYNDLILMNDYIYTVGKDSSNTGIVSKYDLDGNMIKTTNYNYTDSIGLTGITSYNNKIYVVGSKKVLDTNTYDTDALLIKYDSDCDYLSEVTYKGKGLERFNRIILDDNRLVIIGQTGIYNKKKSKNIDVYNYNGIFAKYSTNLKELKNEEYALDVDDYFTDVKKYNNNYMISGYSEYEDNNYLSKFIIYSRAGKLIGAQ